MRIHPMENKYIYEVCIHLPEEILDIYEAWLRPHVDEMLNLPYFTSAQIFKARDLQKGSIELKVHYSLASPSSLDEYLKEAAPRMRAQLPEALHGKVHYTRCLLSTL
jgi:hypothetical protein